MSSKSPGILEPLRVRIRRLQFIVGLGFLSLVMGAVFTSSFAFRIAPRIQDLPEFLKLPIVIALENLWLLGVLPLLCYGAARILELKPLSTALGAAVAGTTFPILISFVQNGLEGLWSGWLSALLNGAAFALGVFLSYRAVVKGRASAAEGTARAQAQAEARKMEYMEFLRESERGAEKSAQREAERAAVATSVGGAAVAVAPEGGALGEAASARGSGGVAAGAGSTAMAAPAAVSGGAGEAAPGAAGVTAVGVVSASVSAVSAEASTEAPATTTNGVSVPEGR